ncbi:MAG: hypothetical protein M3N33_00250 [Actinomycetota bacterium]|nr:hypothetical protein [Actinomycetota bacterium]
MPAEGQDAPVGRAIDGDSFAGALVEAMTDLAPRLPGGWIQRRGNVFAVFTGLPFPTLNGVLCTSPRADVADVDALLQRVRATGVPHSLQLNPRSAPELASLAEKLGMSAVEHVPAMILEDKTMLVTDLAAPVAVRLLGPGEPGFHLVAAAGFDTDMVVFAPLAQGARHGPRGSMLAKWTAGPS